MAGGGLYLWAVVAKNQGSSFLLQGNILSVGCVCLTHLGQVDVLLGSIQLFSWQA